MAPHDVRIDIVPASAELVAAGELVWPGTDFRMSLVGFQLAFEQGDFAEVAAGVSVLVASLPAIIVLKMAAYLDRPAAREKDLEDLAVILERLAALGPATWSRDVAEANLRLQAFKSGFDSGG